MPKKIVISKLGGPEVLKYVNYELPKEIKDDEVLIKVHAAGINNTDINTRIAWYSKNNLLGNSIEIGEKGLDNKIYNDKYHSPGPPSGTDQLAYQLALRSLTAGHSGRGSR